ncbi:histidine kinase [Streptomyces sp. NPDC051576]|uniref:sensor histidine kinase n=1 Tax=Streptomyces sp. NPDC051576 TaxID=3155803 RepID=UPI003420034E
MQHGGELRLVRRLASIEERSALARALHDSVGHAASLIALRAEALGSRTPDSDTAGEASAIHALSRRALEEMRAVTSMLRSQDGDPRVGNLREIPQLLARAGLTDSARIAVDAPDRWPGDVQHAAYRVVQEALTNAARHAPEARIEVTVDSSTSDGSGEQLFVEVRNEPTRLAVPSIPRGGTGLAGLFEQVTQVDGEFVYGRTEDGGFHVRAVF